jgi:hypothetical protein
MKASQILHLRRTQIAVTAAVLLQLLPGCSSNAEAPRSSSDAGTGLDTSPGSDATRDGGVDDSGAVLEGGDAPVDASLPGTLVVTLDPTLDQDDDAVKAGTISTAVLLDGSGMTKAVAMVVNATAVFDISSLTAGDYFLDINGDADDLVPTRIDDPTGAITQRVGQKLRASYVGPIANPAYRINTYSAGQNESSVVRYSDGTTISGEQPYVIYSFASSQMEISLLGTAQRLTSLPLPRCVGHSDVPADAWLLNTTSEDHHGDVFNADGGAGDCQTCHWYGTEKKYTFGAVTATDGWCYRCHYGAGGASAGFVDPTK